MGVRVLTLLSCTVLFPCHKRVIDEKRVPSFQLNTLEIVSTPLINVSLLLYTTTTSPYGPKRKIRKSSRFISI